MKFFASVLLCLAFGSGAAGATLDTILFGDFESERSHSFSGEHMERLDGALGVSARRLFPQEPESYLGGKLYFHMRMNPRKLNYITVKFWGGEVNPNLLILSVEGKQLGYRYLGEIDILDSGSSEQPAPGRFYYVTVPVPVSVTYGKDKVTLEIQATGPVRRFGRGFGNYQQMMTQPSRAVYALYVHDDGFFVLPKKEVQGKLPEAKELPNLKEISTEPVKARVNRELDRLLEPSGFLAPQSVRIGNQLEMRLLAHAYFADWSSAYKNPGVLKSIIGGVDNCFRRLRKDPLLAQGDRSVRYPRYTAFGPAAEAVVLLAGELGTALDEKIPDGTGGQISRRQAWMEVFGAGVEHLAASRSFFPTLAMVGDVNLHWCNRALKLLDPSRGLPLEQTLGFLHEAAGVKPWSGALDGEVNFDKNEKLFTAKGLAKLPDSAGGSSEELGLLYRLYDATRPAVGEKGDPVLLEALLKCFRARSYFRYPARDSEGCPVMRQEGVINWYRSQLPGSVAYGELWSNDGTPLQTAAETRDPLALGSVNFRSIEKELPEILNQSRAENMVRLLRFPADLSRLGDGTADLPMQQQKSFVFTDEENGLLALKDGDTILYGAFYWRARYGINFLARFHQITPEWERIATVRQEIEYEQSRLFYSRPNWINFGFGNGGIGYPDKVLSLHEGETLPLPRLPLLPDFQPGTEHPDAGRGDYYNCSFGPWLFGMNATSDKEFELKVPEGKIAYRSFPGGNEVKPGEILKVGPLSTVVLKAVNK